jgi:hypothetical protein
MIELGVEWIGPQADIYSREPAGPARRCDGLGVEQETTISLT